MYGSERANNISRFEQLTDWTIKPRILLPLEGIDLSHARKNITKGGGESGGGEGRVKSWSPSRFPYKANNV